MIEREYYERKKNLQNTKNVMRKIEGITVLGYEEQTIFDEITLKNIGFYSGAKVTDSKIAYSSNEADIIEWIISLIDFNSSQRWYLWFNSFLIKFQLADIRMAILNLWNNLEPYSKGFILINENKNIMYEIGSDSRDEYNILFDTYQLDKYII